MKRLQLKKGVRYSMQVAAVIALGLATEATQDRYEVALKKRNESLKRVVDEANAVNGADGLVKDEPYYSALIHIAPKATFDYKGHRYATDLPLTQRLFMAVDMVGASPDTAVLTGYATTDAYANLVEALDDLVAIEVQRNNLQEHVFNELQKLQSLSAILGTYPDAINYMPADMVESVDAPALTDLLKIA